MDKKIKVLLFGSDDTGVLESMIREGNLSCEVKKTGNSEDYINTLKTEVFDIILSGSTLEDSEVISAFKIAREITPHSAFIFLGSMNSKRNEQESKLSNVFNMLPNAEIDILAQTIKRILAEVEDRQSISCHWG